MAESSSKGLELSAVERGWIKKALELQRQSIVRSSAREMIGSEVYELRKREVMAIDALLNRF